MNYESVGIDLSQFVPHGTGAVVGLSYFTRAQMKDSRWEFGRIEHGIGLQCGSATEIVRRDVRWFDPTPVSKVACAKVVYSLFCVPEENRGTEFDHINPEVFDKQVAQLLNEPPTSPVPENCGEKDGFTIWEKEVKEQNPGLVAPTSQDIRESEIDRLAKLAPLRANAPSNPAGASPPAIEIRKLVCRPNSLKSFYCKYELRTNDVSRPDGDLWTVRRVRMQQRGFVWQQSEY